MEYVSAYILLAENNQEPTKANITSVLAAIDAALSEESLDLFLSKIEGRSFSEIIASGSELMKSQMSSASSGGAVDQSNAKAEEEVVQESSSSSGADMDFF